MGLTFATPNGGNSASTGHKNTNNNASANKKTSSYSSSAGKANEDQKRKASADKRAKAQKVKDKVEADKKAKQISDAGKANEDQRRKASADRRAKAQAVKDKAEAAKAKAAADKVKADKAAAIMKRENENRARAKAKAKAEADAKAKKESDRLENARRIRAETVAQDKKEEAKRVSDMAKAEGDRKRKAAESQRVKAQADKVKAEAAKNTKIETTIPVTETNVDTGLLSGNVKTTPLADATVEESNNPFSGVGDWFSDLFGGDTSSDTEEEKTDSVGSALGFLAAPGASILKGIFKESQTGMNDEAKDEWALLNREAARDPNNPWHTMSDAEKASLARKPQMDNQLAHAYIGGPNGTQNEAQLDALRPAHMPKSQWDKLPRALKLQLADHSLSVGAGGYGAGNGGNGGNGGGTAPAPAPPNWWEPGNTPPDDGGGIWTPDPTPPQYGGGYGNNGLPDYLQRELAYTPDFTGSFQSGLLGSTALPSQQITGLLAPPQPQRQPQQQFDPEQVAGLLRGFM